MTEVRFNSVDNETGVSYAVVVSETDATVGVVTREEGQRVWNALATGRKVVLKEEFGTRKAAAEALVQIAKEKLARAEERKAARAAAKEEAEIAAEVLAAIDASDSVTKDLVEDPFGLEKAETTVCCGEPETCEADCPAPVADPVEIQNAIGGPTVTWVTASSAGASSTSVSGATLTGTLAVPAKPTVRQRIRRFFGA